MAGQSLPRLLVGAALAAGVVALVAAGVMFRATDGNATGSGTGEPVTIPEVPATEPPPPPGSQAFERPLFHRDRAPGPDQAPAVEPSDPTTPATATDDPTEITLHGVIISERGPRAALRGATAPEPKWVGKGDAIDGWTVESITAELVRLRNGDEVVEIRFPRDR